MCTSVRSARSDAAAISRSKESSILVTDRHPTARVGLRYGASGPAPGRLLPEIPDVPGFILVEDVLGHQNPVDLVGPVSQPSTLAARYMRPKGLSLIHISEPTRLGMI